MIVIESLSHINVPAKNIEESIEFYTMLLDFEVVSQTDREAVVTFDDKLNLRLFAAEESQVPYAYPLITFCLDEDDFTEALQELESENIKISEGPNARGNGEYVYINDPAGNVIEFFYKE